MNETETPNPGEVWIVTDPKLGLASWERITETRPFIVTYVSLDRIGYVCAGVGPNPDVHSFARSGPHSFPWYEHCTRLWPPVPTWDELKRPELAEDDLRSRHLAEDAAR